MDQSSTTPRALFMGQLSRDYFVLPDGKVMLDVPGGNLIYAAVGHMIWEAEPAPGLVARTGEDYPLQWITEFQKRGMDTRGIKILPEPLDLRSFYVYSNRNTRLIEDPVVHFARLGIPFPKELLGYRVRNLSLDSRTKLLPGSLRQSDIPPAYLDAGVAHLCPVDYLTHTLMPAVLRQAGFTTVTLDPTPGTMNPIFWDYIPALLTGLTAFLPSEEEIRALFHGRSSDLWEMMEALGKYGCEFIVVKRGETGQYVYDSTSRTHYEIPSYPSRLVNAHGAGDAFCGGFLAGYRRTFDPVQAAIYGNVSSSLVVEGTGPFFALEALPGLARARLEALRDTVRKV